MGRWPRCCAPCNYSSLLPSGWTRVPGWWTSRTYVPDERRGSEKNGGQADQALARSRVGLTTKLHVVTDGQGLPLGLHLTSGPQHEATHLVAVCEQVALPRRPRRLVADRGYDSQRVRAWLRQRRIRAVIPRRRVAPGRRNRRRGRPRQVPATLYAQRNAVERFFGWLKEHRRLATRFEKLADTYLDMVRLACIKRLLNHLFSDAP